MNLYDTPNGKIGIDFSKIAHFTLERVYYPMVGNFSNYSYSLYLVLFLSAGKNGELTEARFPISEHKRFDGKESNQVLYGKKIHDDLVSYFSK